MENPTDNSDSIAGVFNYCDRWCERCVLTERCGLYHEEQSIRARHEAAGRDPDDWVVIIEEITASISRAAEMLAEQAEALGVDLSDTDSAPGPSLPDPKEHPIHENAMRFATETHAFLERLRGELQVEGRAALEAPEDVLFPRADVQRIEDAG